jgi:hydantoinase/carbamoylase family amidase
MTKADLKTSSDRVVADLRKLAELTSTPEGAQRLAWGPIWRQAREWYLGLVAEIGLTHTRDSAGNLWVTLEGESSKSVLIGSHLDSVPNGGWLDGCLGVLVGLEALRRYQAEGKKPPVTLKVVDWADEEGARFGRSLLGSSAAAGTLKIAEVEHLADRQGTKLPDAFRENGVELSNVLQANSELKAQNGQAYLELHIEQGPVLESLQKSTGAVIGTFGVERHMMRFTGQAAHSGSTPIPMRKDAFLAAAQTALAIREIGLKHSKPDANVVCTCGVVKVEPCIVTAVPGSCELSLDMRAMNADVLASMYAEAKQAAAKAAADNGVTVEWSLLWEIEPRPFDPHLIQLCEDAVREVTNDCHRLPSGPLHDAAEMVPYMPTVMMFAYSARGLSHCKEEDTPAEHLEKTIQAFMRLVDKTVDWCATKG